MVKEKRCPNCSNTEWRSLIEGSEHYLIGFYCIRCCYIDRAGF